MKFISLMLMFCSKHTILDHASAAVRSSVWSIARISIEENCCSGFWLAGVFSQVGLPARIRRGSDNLECPKTNYVFCYSLLREPKENITRDTPSTSLSICRDLTVAVRPWYLFPAHNTDVLQLFIWHLWYSILGQESKVNADVIDLQVKD